MSVLTLRPNSDSSITQSRSTGSYNYAVVDETTKDESDYTYVMQTKNGPTLIKRDLYGFPNHTSESGTINSVTLKAYCKGSGGTAYSKIRFFLSISSTDYDGSFQEIAKSTTLYSEVWSSNPAGGAWSWTDIDNLLAGDKLSSSGTPSGENYTYKYQFWVEVDYTAAGGTSIIHHILTRKPFRHMLIR